MATIRPANKARTELRAMAPYAVHFEFNEPMETQIGPRHELQGDTLENAKMEAALLYALADFGTLPAAYTIVQEGRGEVYRYPEVATDRDCGPKLIWSRSA